MQKNRQLIIICGLPATGKSTLGKALGEKLHTRWLDLEEHVLFPIFGLPDPNPYQSKGDTLEELRREFRKSYDLLIHATEAHLDLGRSIIITAPFSNERVQQNFMYLQEKYPTCDIFIVYCTTRRGNIEQNEIRKRLATRVFGKDYFGCCNNLEHYLYDKPRFVEPTVPHLELDTFPPYTVEECLQKILDHIHSTH